MKTLKEIATRLYGESKWQQDLAEALEVDTSSIRRWKTYENCPGPVRAALRCFLRERNINNDQLGG